MAEHEALHRFAEDVGRFHLRERRMRSAQAVFVKRLEAREGPSVGEVRAYLLAVRTYFTGFDREAHAHLRDLDRRLAKVSQLQFNLTAERGVAARRIELTQGVLSRLAEVAGQ